MTECLIPLTKGVSHSPALSVPPVQPHPFGVSLRVPGGTREHLGLNCDAGRQQEPGLQAGGRWASPR